MRSTKEMKIFHLFHQNYHSYGIYIYMRHLSDAIQRGGCNLLIEYTQDNGNIFTLRQRVPLVTLKPFSKMRQKKLNSGNLIPKN